MNEDSGTTRPTEPDPNESPFESPGIAGIPYGRKSKEAQTIKRFLERMKREREAAATDQTN